MSSKADLNPIFLCRIIDDTKQIQKDEKDYREIEVNRANNYLYGLSKDLRRRVEIFKLRYMPKKTIEIDEGNPEKSKPILFLI